MTNTIHDDITVLRIRIPVIRDEEEEEHTVTPYEEYFHQDYDSEYEYDPFDDLDNHYACLEYFELLRQARRQLQTDPETGHTDFYEVGPFDIFSPIPVINDYD